MAYLWVAICLIFLCKLSHSQNCSEPKCLLETLLHSYRHEVIPVCGQQSSVQVEIQLVFRQIVDLVETKQILTTNVWIRLIWADCNMKWNPADYNGSDLISLPFDRIWTPDVTLYDDSAFGSNVAMSERKYHKLSVTSEGKVLQRFPTVLSSICGVDATYFPFDKQRCQLTFGLWVYDDSQVNLISKSDGDTTVFQENAEWDLQSVKSERLTSIHSNLTFSTITYTIVMQRRPAFFMLTLFFPCFIICTMAILGFFLPPSSDQKVGLQVTLLLALTVFEFLTLGLMPPNSKPLPLMCVYFAMVMILASLSCVLSVVVLKVHLKGQQGWKVSPKIRNLLIDKVGRMLFVKRPHTMRDHVESDLNKESRSTITNRRMSTISVLNEDDSGSEFGAILKCFQKISKRLEDLLQHIEDEKAAQESVEYQDWLTVASILDRLFLILYVFLSVIVFMVFLIKLST